MLICMGLDVQSPPGPAWHCKRVIFSHLSRSGELIYLLTPKSSPFLVALFHHVDNVFAVGFEEQQGEEYCPVDEYVFV